MQPLRPGHAGPVLRSYGAMVRRLVAAGVTHGDCGPDNVLLDPGTHEALRTTAGWTEL